MPIRSRYGANGGTFTTRDDPFEDLEAVTKRYADALSRDMSAYLPRNGGSMLGPLIGYSDSGAASVGIGIGDNSTGFYRVGNTLLISVSDAYAISGQRIDVDQPTQRLAAAISASGCGSNPWAAASRPAHARAASALRPRVLHSAASAGPAVAPSFV